MSGSNHPRPGGVGGRLVLLVALAALVASAPSWAANPCAECHEEQVQPLLATPHRGVAAEGATFCAACHGDPSKHLESGEAKDIAGSAALSAWDAGRQAAACLSCHRADFPAWDQVPHAGRVSCWSCHADRALHFEPQGPALPAAARHRTWALCTSCHGSVQAEFRQQYRHPVEQGLLDCTDCHDVHGREVAGGEITDRLAAPAAAACVRCHEQQAGPYLFEHPAMEDGCTSCHRPHGSWNRDLLVSVGNGACLSCHLQSTFPGVSQIDHEFRLNGGGRCWDCHSDVHGSNTTPDFNPRGRR